MSALPVHFGSALIRAALLCLLAVGALPSLSLGAESGPVVIGLDADMSSGAGGSVPRF